MSHSKYTQPLVFIYAFLLLANVAVANEFQQAVKNSTTSVNLRAAYIRYKPDVAGNQTTSAAAIAGQIKIETAAWKNLQFALAPYFVEKIDSLSGDESQGKLNSDFFDSNNDSFAYLAEAYINYKHGNINLRIGRQQLDNPFINTDDIRMHPNTFHAIWANYRYNKDINLEIGKVKKWTGFDSGRDQHIFKNASNDGVTALGASYQMKQHHLFQLWYYDFNKSHRQFYFDATYTNGPFEAGLQYSDYSEDNASNIDGSVYGLSVTYAFDKLKLNAAINESSNDTGKSVDNGLGGGNFYTSMDEITIAGITDASSYMLAAEYEVLKDLTLRVALAHYEDKTDLVTDLSEKNLVLNYVISANTDIEYVYVSTDNPAIKMFLMKK